MAGLTYAVNNSRMLIVDVSGLKDLSHGLGSSITHFNLPGRFVKSDLISFVAKTWRRIATQKVLSRFNLGVFVAPNLGFQREILSSSQRVFFLEGFFHTHAYFDFLQKTGHLFSLELKSPSSWLNQNVSLLANKKIATAHLRLGDFESSWRHFGILAADYYIREFGVLKELGVEEIWVFTNDIPKAKKLFANYSLISLRFIEPPSDVPDAESLYLMSKSDYIITGNSTFSWWAAIISKQGTRVVAPLPFFRSEEGLELFYPSSWNLSDSVWQDY